MGCVLVQLDIGGVWEARGGGCRQRGALWNVSKWWLVVLLLVQKWLEARGAVIIVLR